jgi:hypothetical protein
MAGTFYTNSPRSVSLTLTVSPDGSHLVVRLWVLGVVRLVLNDEPSCVTR